MTIKSGDCAKVMSGSVQSDWIVAVSDATATAESGAGLLNPSASTAATKVPIPFGATRVLVRSRFASNVANTTTEPVITIWGTDRNGVPLRLDNIDPNAAGITMVSHDTVASNPIGADFSSSDPVGGNTSTFRYGQVTSLSGYDCLGSQWLYILRSTAAGYASSIMVLFLN